MLFFPSSRRCLDELVLNVVSVLISHITDIISSIEVLSGNDYCRNWRMAAIRGMDILRYHRNYWDSKEVTTFVFPKPDIKASVGKVIVKWKSDQLCFDITYEEVVQSVKDEVIEVIREGIKRVDTVHFDDIWLHCIPLSKDLEVKFGKDAAQIFSNQAVIGEN